MAGYDASSIAVLEGLEAVRNKWCILQIVI